MADFAIWATAAETALGLQSGAFMDAYASNHSHAVQETLESDPVGAAVFALFGDETDECEWSGRSKDLLKFLEQRVDERVQKSRAWPKTPRGLSSRLRRLVSFLREADIEIIFPDPHNRATGGQRILTIRRMPSHLTATTGTTTAAEPPSLLNQSSRTGEASDGQSLRAADESHEGNHPPLEPIPSYPIEGAALPRQAAVAAVVCKPDLVQLQETEGGMAEVDL